MAVGAATLGGLWRNRPFTVNNITWFDNVVSKFDVNILLIFLDPVNMFASSM
jgi:hypothetical protein